MANDNNSSNSYDIVCPYCFKRFTDYRTLFVDSKQFTDSIYPEYIEYLRYFLGIESVNNRKMPLLFTKNVNDGAQDKFCAVTESGDLTFTRACPFCCNILPAASGKEKSFSVAVIGESNEGRSFYIASVLHKLNKEMQSRFGVSFMPADHKTAKTFYDEYDEPLYASKTVPEAMGTVVPLIYDFRRTGTKNPEEWKGDSVTYNRALVYIYNIDKDLCDRYPMIAFTALSQASAVVFVADISENVMNSDPTYDPWLGYLTETISRIYGSMTVGVPSAIVLDRADKAAITDKKWSSLLKAALAKPPERDFPEQYFRKISNKISAVLKQDCPAFSSTVSALFSPEDTMFFPAKASFEMHEDGSAEIGDSTGIETSFLWILSKLKLIDDQSQKSFKLQK